MTASIKRMSLLGAAIGALVALVPTVVSAYTSQSYCGMATSPKTRCSNESTVHSWNDNVASGSATDNGNRYLAKCEVLHDGAGNNYSRNCASAIQVWGHWDDYNPWPIVVPNPGQLLQAAVGNDEQYRTQIMGGVARYGTS
jgi:hypothetical protein